MFVPEWDGQVCSLGYDLIDWIEAYCCHGPGDVQGRPVELDQEMATFVVRAYELDPRTGRRKIDRAMLSRPKGRAKSELAGMIATAEAFAPVRFDGWSADGQPVGRPVVSPLIKCLATEESQAGNTFENAAFIVSDWGRDAHPDIYGGASGVRQYQSATAIYLPGGGEMRASTSGSASKDGGKESFVVPDETHLYVTNELRSMYATVARNCGKRKEAEPWMLQTTTAYEEGRNSVAEQVLTAWKDGKLPNPAHWLVDHREAVGSVDVENRRHTMEQLRYVYGAAAAWMDLDRIYRTMLDPTECETPAVAARYFLNVPVVGTLASAALPIGAWRKCADETSSIEGTPVLAISMTPDRSTVSLVGAGRRVDDLIHVETVLHGSAGRWFIDKTIEIARRQGSPVAFVASHPVGALAVELEKAGIHLRALTSVDYTKSCGAFYDDVMACRLRYIAPQPELDEAVALASRKKTMGDAWRWAGEGISALVAASQAVFEASRAPVGGKGRAIALA